MKLIYSKHFPFKGYKAITIWPYIIIRKDQASRYMLSDDNHERIHGSQQCEMLLVFFFLWYAVEWLIRLLLYRDSHRAYRSISFEREAHSNEHNIAYLRQRKPFAWVKYLFRN